MSISGDSFGIKHIETAGCYIGEKGSISVIRGFLAIWKNDGCSGGSIAGRTGWRACKITETQRLLRLGASLTEQSRGGGGHRSDVFVRFASLARTFRLTGSLKGYLATCVANAARNQLTSRDGQTTGLEA